jgi:hypothetical protein
MIKKKLNLYPKIFSKLCAKTISYRYDEISYRLLGNIHLNWNCEF